MELVGVAVLAGFVLAFALVSRRLETTPVTGPMLFVGVGILLGSSGVDLLEVGMDQGTVRVLAEATLVLLLFTDAIRIDLRRLRDQIDLPARLLGIGLPLTVIAGTLLAVVILPGLGIWEAALVAAILSPTDAALGQAVVSNQKVPARIRQALNVESGLNDGIMLPVITLLLAATAAGVDLETPQYWARFAARQIGFGALVGIALGYGGGWLIVRFSNRGWMDGAFRQLATLAVGVAAFAAAESLGGNGFVAAFVAGLAFGAAAREHCDGVYDFAEDEGQLLALLTFLFFGAALAGPALSQLTWQIALYALASLTIVRMVPVALSLVRSGLHPVTVAYFGWFGPGGLASIVFGLFILEEADLPMGDDLFLVVTWTVLASVFLHGATSVALSERYASWFSRRVVEAMPEADEVEEMPTR
ncbi:MAG TPA: sodium:proton exchanger [Actinobacteria bacterium]|nr:sodium:proton exchanger [Actinomycetota bacterium]